MLTVRPAIQADIPAVLTLLDALADYEKLPRPNAEARARLAGDGWERNPARFFVMLAERENEAVGYAIFFETYSTFLARPTLYIEDLFVRPEARGGGVGKALLRELCDEAKKRDCGRMEWVCLNWNETAIGFYEKHGAKFMDDWRTYRLTDDEFGRLL